MDDKPEVVCAYITDKLPCWWWPCQVTWLWFPRPWLKVPTLCAVFTPLFWFHIPLWHVCMCCNVTSFTTCWGQLTTSIHLGFCVFKFKIAPLMHSHFVVKLLSWSVLPLLIFLTVGWKGVGETSFCFYVKHRIRCKSCLKQFWGLTLNLMNIHFVLCGAITAHGLGNKHSIKSMTHCNHWLTCHSVEV